jgi:L-ribulose-5-phosphate 3-epimerase
MNDALSRREFMAALAAAALVNSTGCASAPPAPHTLPFKISLAEWSLHRTIRAKEMDHLDFARVTRQVYNLDAVEYVNGFFKDKATDFAYLNEMTRRAREHGVTQHLIMIDGEGRLGDPDKEKQNQAIFNHRKWVDAAATLGCVSIRVNPEGEGEWEVRAQQVADGLRRLSEYGEEVGINILIENHGSGLSSNGEWLSRVILLVDHPRCGTLPDFGNFHLGEGRMYDIYKGTAELMRYAKAVSAKSHDFSSAGEETAKDYRRLMKIVTDAGYHSWVGIEYEGEHMSERNGIMATLRLLKTIQAEMSA